MSLCAACGTATHGWIGVYSHLMCRNMSGPLEDRAHERRNASEFQLNGVTWCTRSGTINVGLMTTDEYEERKYNIKIFRYLLMFYFLLTTNNDIYLCLKNPDMVTTFRYRTCHQPISDSNTPHNSETETQIKRTRVRITCTSRPQTTVPRIRGLSAWFPPGRPVFDPRSVPLNF